MVNIEFNNFVNTASHKVLNHVVKDYVKNSFNGDESKTKNVLT